MAGNIWQCWALRRRFRCAGPRGHLIACQIMDLVPDLLSGAFGRFPARASSTSSWDHVGIFPLVNGVLGLACSRFKKRRAYYLHFD